MSLQNNENFDLLKKIVLESKAIVLDIEGTTTAFDFVQKELFPYAEKHLSEYIINHWNDKEVQDALIDLQRQSLLDEEEHFDGFVPLPHSPASPENVEETQEYQAIVVANLKWQMKNDRKTTGLKKIQGLIWRGGYESELITSHMYPDVIDALKIWSSDGKDIFIYSSGSKEAQIYLFRYSILGDLTKYILEYFDTTIGSKLESSSYKHICKFATRKPHEVVFFTDRPKEIVAAKDCGMKAILVEREPNHPLIKAEENFLGFEDGKIISFNDVLHFK